MLVTKNFSVDKKVNCAKRIKCDAIELRLIVEYLEKVEEKRNKYKVIDLYKTKL